MNAPHRNRISPGGEARKSRGEAAFVNGWRKGSEAAEPADTERVNLPLSLRVPACRLPSLAAALLGLVLAAGCAAVREPSRLTKDWRQAEIAVENLTAHPWRIALRSTQGEEVKAVEIRPRESLALVVAGGEYTIEQTLYAPPPAGIATRRFPGRLEAGQRYRWTLATLLSAEEDVTP